MTNAELLLCVPKWRHAEELSLKRRSLIVHAPRYYGKKEFLRLLGARLSQSGDIVLNLSSSTLTPSGQIDFPKLWHATSAQMPSKSRLVVTDQLSFEGAFRALTARTKYRVHVNLSGCGRGNAIRHSQMIGLFNNLLLEDTVQKRNLLTVVAIDDYSLFHHITGKALESDVAYFEKLHISAMTPPEIAEFVRLAAGDGVGLNTLAQILLDVTGGHVGLVMEAMSLVVPHLGAATNWASLEKMTRDHIGKCNIVEGLSFSLKEDPAGLSRTALEYIEPSIPEAASPRIHVLRELGILARDWPSSKLVLCKGVITELVKEVSEGHLNTLSRVGTLLTEFGPRVFEAEGLKIDDDDFVVVLLADMHCSEDQYRFSIKYGGSELNRGKPSLVPLLKDDLVKLEILGRVDALVIAGDIVGNGKPDEYDRAEAIVRDVIARLQLRVDQLIVIPGNHDLDWTPGPVAITEPNRKVTKEGYLRFLRLMGKPTSNGIDFIRVRSRSNQRVLSIFGLDSNTVEGPDAGGIGYVSNSAFEAVEEHLAGLGDGLIQESLVWLTVHHHVFPANNAAVQDAEKKKVSVLANSSQVQSKAIKWSAELIMHGHEHQPSVTVARTWPVEEGREFAPLVVVGAGSVSAQRDLLGEFSRNQYFVLVRRKHDVVIRSRWIGDHGTSFVPHGDVVVPLGARLPRSRPPI